MGSGIGTILASIGIPMLLDAIMGKGLQVDSNRSRRSILVKLPPIPKKAHGGLVLPVSYRSDPFIGTWDQMKNPMFGYGKPKKRQKTTKKRRGITEFGGQLDNLAVLLASIHKL